MLAVNNLASQVGMEAACRAFAFNPGYVYRDLARRRGVFSRHPIVQRPRPPLAFSIAEPATIYATLLDDVLYHL
jgi:hypothetical protein